MRLAAGAFVATLLLLACGCGGDEERQAQATYSFPDAPIDDALSRLLPEAAVGILDPEALKVIAGSHDARLGWLVSDLLRFYQGGLEERQLVSAFRDLTRVDVRRDPRLPVQVEVVGVIDPEGRPVAFAAARARAALAAGDADALAGVELVADGGGLRARSSGGEELPAHQAFWFAWSQFHPDTALWTGR